MAEAHSRSNLTPSQSALSNSAVSDSSNTMARITERAYRDPVEQVQNLPVQYNHIDEYA